MRFPGRILRLGAARCLGSRRLTAFTLIELLVVMGVIALLAGILLPVLGQAKAKGQAISCLNNEKQLILAWQLYADEHEDHAPANFGVAQVEQEISNGTYRNWVNNVLDWSVMNSENTNLSLLFAGGIGRYLGGVDNVYRCPNDFALSVNQTQAGWRSRTRSYSMNAMIGDPGEFMVGGSNTNNPHYRQFLTVTEIPRPSDIFVFIEEHPDTIRDGYFLNNPYELEWVRLPASYHNGGANLAFADGHVEYHRWVVGSTRRAPRPGAVPFPFEFDAPERADFDWLKERVSIKP
jgi:prepilin-type processing-associated H-X9-DG protein/prepilin-type N-terminal cleavage/methylation domain-containing protein